MAGNVTTQGHPPSISLLLTKLLPVVEWELLGVHLTIPKYELEKIRIQFHHEGVERCKLEMFHVWTKVQEPQWSIVADALEKMNDQQELAKKIRLLSLTGEWEDTPTIPPPLVNEELELNDPVMIRIQKSCVKVFIRLESKFAKLITDIQFELQNRQISLEQLHTYIKTRLELYMQPPPQSLDELFNGIMEPYYCFLNVSLIENIIDEFLEGSPVQVRLEEYEKQLESFKSSTTMEDLVELTTSSLKSDEGTVSVVLKLEGCWLNVTLKHFQQLVEEIFLEKSRCLNHIRVRKGCVCVSWLVPDSSVFALISLVKQRVEFMESVGVVRIIIDDKEVMSDDVEGIDSFSRYLVRAITHQEVETIRFLAMVDPSNEETTACLELAVESGNSEIVSVLLEAGAKPNVIGGKGVTPLQRACRNALASVTRMLLEYKADPNFPGIDGSTALMLASNWNNTVILEMLLDSGARVNDAMDDGWTALMMSCDQNHISTVNRLLQAGANPNTYTDSTRWGPVHSATSQYSDPSILLALIEAGANPNAVTSTGATPLTLASKRGHETIVDILLSLNVTLDLQTSNGWTALMAAVHTKNVYIVDAILTAGADVYIIDNNGRNALEWSLQSDHSEITQLLLIYTGDDNTLHTQPARPVSRSKGPRYSLSEDLKPPTLPSSISELKEAIRHPSIPEEMTSKHGQDNTPSRSHTLSRFN